MLRIFLRNHSILCTWADLPAEVRRLFSASGETLSWAEFYMAGRGRGLRQFEFHARCDGELARYRADVVMLQEAFGMVTLVQFTGKRAATSPICTCLASATIERAVLTVR